MQIWTFLHIAAMFGAVMVTAGGALMATWAIRRRDLEALRTYFRMAPRIDAVGGLLFLAGIVLGVINAWVIGWDLLASWLIAAYVLVVLIIIVGGLMRPYLARVKAALAASDELDRDQVSEGLEAQLSRPNATIGSVVLILLIVAVIHDMVFKPGT
jgi:uncharacterized membrane protein SirB2